MLPKLLSPIHSKQTFVAWNCAPETSCCCRVRPNATHGTIHGTFCFSSNFYPRYYRIFVLTGARALYTAPSTLAGTDLPFTPRGKKISIAYIPAACKALPCCFSELIMISSPLKIYCSAAHGLAVHLMRSWRPAAPWTSPRRRYGRDHFYWLGQSGLEGHDILWSMVESIEKGGSTLLEPHHRSGGLDS